MKKLLILLTLLTLAWLSSQEALARTTIKIATIVPEGTDWMRDMRAGVKEIEERTEGRVSFKIYSGGVQGTDAQIRRKMRIGQLHGGAFVNTSLRDFQRDAEVYGLPMLFRDYDEVRHVRERFDERLLERMREAGYEGFGFAGGGFAYLVSSTSIADREDMRGLKVWIPEGSRVARDASRALGIAPVTLPATDVLTGLQTELIDTVMGPPVGIIVMQWHTAMTHVTDLPIAYSYAILLIDRRVFGKLEAADQAVITEVMRRVYRGFDEAGVEEDREAHQALLDDGLERVSVTTGERRAWQQLINESNRKAGAAGEFDLALLDEIQCHLEAYRGGAEAGSCGP